MTERWLECSNCCKTIVIPDGLATVRWVNGDPICPTCGNPARYYDIQEVGAGVTRKCDHKSRECTYESDDGEFERWQCKDCGARWGVEIAQ